MRPETAFLTTPTLLSKLLVPGLQIPLLYLLRFGVQTEIWRLESTALAPRFSNPVHQPHTGLRKTLIVGRSRRLAPSAPEEVRLENLHFQVPQVM